MKVTHSIYTLPAILLALIYQARSLDYGQLCETPFEEIGECVRIRNCPKFAHIAEGPIDADIPDETYNVLKKSWCGKWRDFPLVCCPYEKIEATTTTTSSPSVQYGESCRTPERRRGSCIRVKQCPRFAHLIERERIPQSAVNILNESYCGTFRKVPLICCPTESTTTPRTTTPRTTTTSTTPVSTTVTYKGICWTPNAVKGKCIKARDCPEFAEAVNRFPESESIQEALNESFCGVRRNHKLVCCPDDDPIPQTTPYVLEAIEVGVSCQTPTGEGGTCMREIDCTHQNGVALLNQSVSNKKSFCGVKDGERLICCVPTAKHTKIEARCLTPSHQDGKCISLNECPALSSLVDPKRLTKYALEQLQKSHCGSHDEDNMYCCPSSATDNRDINDLKQHQNLYLLDQNICGKSPLLRPIEDRTEIGKKAKLSTIPWMALIAYTSDTASTFRCVGSIINRRYILTAARCVSNLSRDIRPVSVRLGEHNLDYALDCTDDTCAPAPQNIFIEELIPHPDFIGRLSPLNDIALIRLTKDINFGTGPVQPVCLPIEESLRAKDYTNKRLLVSGWFTSGDELSSELLQDVVQGVSHKVCSEAYANMTTILPDSHLCVHNGRGDDCLGKGASPLVSFEEYLGRKAAVQQGIGLFGPNICYLTTQPVVYTRVGKFMKWILDNLRP